MGFLVDLGGDDWGAFGDVATETAEGGGIAESKIAADAAGVAVFFRLFN